MRMLVVADSHHDISCLAIALRKFAGKVDMVAHLGDGADDIERAAEAARVRMPRVEAVRGNGDFEPWLWPRLLIGSADRPILLLHGHLEGVNISLSGILSAATAVSAGLVLFGHTHKAFFEEYHGVLALNPGSIARPRGRDEPTFAVVDAPEEKERGYDVQFYEVERSFGRIRKIDVA
jgi:putative phosphoesterase